MYVCSNSVYIVYVSVCVHMSDSSMVRSSRERVNSLSCVCMCIYVCKLELYVMYMNSLSCVCMRIYVCKLQLYVMYVCISLSAHVGFVHGEVQQGEGEFFVLCCVCVCMFVCVCVCLCRREGVFEIYARTYTYIHACMHTPQVTSSAVLLQGRSMVTGSYIIHNHIHTCMHTPQVTSSAVLLQGTSMVTGSCIIHNHIHTCMHALQVT
jgi:hypothetical protein